MKFKAAFLGISLLASSLILASDVADEGNEPASAWLGNKLGVNHSVPSPWTPLKVEKNSVGAWGREIKLAGSGFPEQIINQNKPMLVAPISLKVDLGDKKLVNFKHGKLEKLNSFDDEAVFKGVSTLNDIIVTTKATVEFDGFIKFELNISAKPGVKVKRLMLDCPFRPDLIGPYYISPFRGYSPSLIFDTWGSIKTQRGFKFYNYFTLAGTELSMNWSAESPEGWRLQKRKRALEVIPSEDEFLFRVNFIDAFAPVEIGQSRKIVFALQPGPFRPALKDWRKYTALWWEPKPKRVAEVVETGLKPMVCLWPFSTKGTAYKKHLPEYSRASRKAFNIPLPENPIQFREWIKETKSAGGLVMPYINTDDFELLWGPGSGKFREEWAGKALPEEIEKETPNGFHPRHGFAVCYWSDSWEDYYVYTLVNAMKNYKYDGYYCDNTGCRACSNPNHPDSHKAFLDEDRRTWNRTPIFKTRNFYKRIYKAVKEANPNAVFFVNGGTSPFGFWDFRLTAEYLNRIGGEIKWTEFATPEQIKGPFFRGQQFGVMKLGYPVCIGKNNGRDGVSAMLSVLVMGDTVDFWEIMCHLPTLMEFDKLKASFKIWNAVWVPYWKSGDYMSSDKKDVYLTLYKKENEALLFISNPQGTQAEDAKINIKMDGIFKEVKNISIKGAESGDKIETKASMVLNDTMHMFNIKVPAQDFRAVIISNK